MPDWPVHAQKIKETRGLTFDTQRIFDPSNVVHAIKRRPDSHILQDQRMSEHEVRLQESEQMLRTLQINFVT